MLFEDRDDAGEQLAYMLNYLVREQPLIVALPRGGVPIGFQLARVLYAPLTVLVVRKISTPARPELGIGAIAEGNVQLFDTTLLDAFQLTKKDIAEEIAKEQKELQRRLRQYRHNKPLPSLKGKTVILVDDGLATGITAQAAIMSLRALSPKRLIFAAPVCAADTAAETEHMVDNLICLSVPARFRAVGLAYRQFKQLSDQEVIALLHKAERFTSTRKQIAI